MTSRDSRRKRLLRGRRRSVAFAVLLGLALPNADTLASDALYQWTDERGNVRYTTDPDRVPSGQRENVLRLEPGMPPAGAPARPAAAPGEPSAPPLQPLPAASASPAPVRATGAATVPTAAPDAALHPPVEPSTTVAPSAAAAPRPTPPSNAQTAPPASVADATREQQLSAAIAADQETLRAMLAAPPVPGETALVDSPQLRAIALRLPELQAELRALRERQTPPVGP